MAPSTALVRHPHGLSLRFQSRKEREESYRLYNIRSRASSTAIAHISRHIKESTASQPQSYPFHKSRSLLFGRKEENVREKSLLFDREDDADTMGSVRSESKLKWLKRLKKKKHKNDAKQMERPPAHKVRKVDQRDDAIKSSANYRSRQNDSDESNDEDSDRSFLEGLNKPSSMRNLPRKAKSVGSRGEKRAQIRTVPRSLSSSTKIKQQPSAEISEQLELQLKTIIVDPAEVDDMSSILFDGDNLRDKPPPPPRSMVSQGKERNQLRRMSTSLTSLHRRKKSAVKKEMEPIQLETILVIDPTDADDDMSSLRFDGAEVRDRRPKLSTIPTKTTKAGSTPKELIQHTTVPALMIIPPHKMTKNPATEQKTIAIIDPKEEDENISPALLARDEVTGKPPPTKMLPETSTEAVSQGKRQIQSRTASSSSLSSSHKMKKNAVGEQQPKAGSQGKERIPSRSVSPTSLSSKMKKNAVGGQNHKPDSQGKEQFKTKSVSPTSLISSHKAKKIAVGEQNPKPDSPGKELPSRTESSTSLSSSNKMKTIAIGEQKLLAGGNTQIINMTVAPISVTSSHKLKKNSGGEQKPAIIIDQKVEKKDSTPSKKMFVGDEVRDKPPPSKRPPIVPRKVSPQAERQVKTRTVSPSSISTHRMKKTTAPQQKFTAIDSRDEDDMSSLLLGGDRNDNDTDSGNDGGDECSIECSFERGNMSPILSSNTKKNFAVQGTQQLSARTIRIVEKCKVPPKRTGDGASVELRNHIQDTLNAPAKAQRASPSFSNDGQGRRSPLSSISQPPPPPPTPASLSFASVVSWTSGIGAGVLRSDNIPSPPDPLDSRSVSSLSLSSFINRTGLFRSGNDDISLPSSTRHYPASVA